MTDKPDEPRYRELTPDEIRALQEDKRATTERLRELRAADDALEAGGPVRVYLDDERSAPAGWLRVRWPDEAIRLLEASVVAELSLDHDLGDDARGTGYDVVQWIERAVAERGFVPPERITVHSANPAARIRMEQGIASIYRLASTSR